VRHGQTRGHARRGLDSSRDGSVVEPLGDLAWVEPGGGGVAQQIRPLELALVLEEEVVDAPEGVVSAEIEGDLGEFGRLLRVLVGAQGQVTEDDAQVVGIGST